MEGARQFQDRSVRGASGRVGWAYAGGLRRSGDRSQGMLDQNLSFKPRKQFSATTPKPSPPSSRTPPPPASKSSDLRLLSSAHRPLITDYRLPISAFCFPNLCFSHTAVPTAPNAKRSHKSEFDFPSLQVSAFTLRPFTAFQYFRSQVSGFSLSASSFLFSWLTGTGGGLKEDLS